LLKRRTRWFQEKEEVEIYWRGVLDGIKGSRVVTSWR
jgi:hypothetical protein